MKRTRYLKMKTLQQACQLLPENFGQKTTRSERIATSEAEGRVTAEPVFARLSSPGFHSAAMDGIAVRAEDTFSAHETNPLTLDLHSGEAVMINTGQPLPSDKNAVIMIENVSIDQEKGTATIMAPAFPWQHVRKIGEDIVATELLLPSHHLLLPADIGSLLAAGVAEIAVRKQPKITIIPTGSELISLEELNGSTIPPGKTVESNSSMLAAAARAAGATVQITPIVPDNLETLKQAVKKAVEQEADIVLLNAGSSAGTADYTVKVIANLGEVLMHGITIMPGKPTIMGRIEGVPVFGIPGYPVSALISFENLVVPLIKRLQGIDAEERVAMKAICGRNIPSTPGIKEFRRMVAGRLGNNIIVLPVKKGAGAISTMTRANAMLIIPAESEGINAGQEIRIQLLRPASQIEKTVLCIGSHDLTLDLIHDFLKRSLPSYHMAATHVGSLGGITAVRDGLCHVAGTHLLDIDTGEYNISYLKKYLKEGQRVRLYNLVYREQGFIVPKGNPKGISSIKDLAEKKLSFVNRQAGSGTRVLLDYQLKNEGIEPAEINGYDNEEYTHMAVAVNVLSGKADTGLGIQAAARALGLDFIPVAEERYDLLIPEEAMDYPAMNRFMEIIRSQEFREKAEGLGGYSTRESGKLMFKS